MIDITTKQITLRSARAQAKVLCSSETVTLIKENRLPKGNLLEIAKAAGFLAAKKTSDLIPHCHPVGIDHLDITFEVENDGVLVKVYCQSIAKTGIEIEALTSASVAALTIFDLLKPVDKNLEITTIKLLKKTGGKSNQKKEMAKNIKAAVLVCSDSTASGTRQDNSGLIIKDLLDKFDVEVIDYQIVPDDKTAIHEKINAWVKQDIPFIFTTGGTGLSPRDNTVATVKEIIEKEAPGIAEAMRSHGMQRTPLAMHSRSIAGSINQTLIVTLPGSSNGAKESLEAILPGVFHARKMLKGGGH